MTILETTGAADEPGANEPIKFPGNRELPQEPRVASVRDPIREQRLRDAAREKLREQLLREQIARDQMAREQLRDPSAARPVVQDATIRPVVREPVRDPVLGPAPVPVREPVKETANEPIKFPLTKEERREQRQARRAGRKAAAGAAGTADAAGAAAPVPVADPGDAPQPRKKRLAKLRQVEEAPAETETPAPAAAPLRSRLRVSWTLLSFLLMVAIPGAISGFYFTFIASPQYVVESQFSVRGASSQSSIATMGLSGLFGSSVQSGDSYIVASYIESLQLIRDVKEQLGIDLRQYYAKNHIDWLYRIDADMPLEKFTEYWRDMVEVSFNSTTGNTTLYVYAFTADDSKAIADAILKVSETLVNQLSENNRQQMTVMASKQVDRSEERLRNVREQIRKLRAEYKTIDIATLSSTATQLTQSLEAQLQSLRTRLAALPNTMSADSPTVRNLERQIKALEQQLAEEKSKLDISKDSSSKSATATDDSNIAEALNRFEELTVEQGFATQAYTAALAAFETALAEAQKQERYFATFVAPTRPEVALYPMRLLDTFISVLVLLAVWMISQFLYRSFRDHAI